MLTMQLGAGIAEAFARLRAYAYINDRRLADVASDIVARRLRLHRDPGRERRPVRRPPPGLRAARGTQLNFLPLRRG